jgi:Zn-finger nucleic acid-binding protein
MDMGELQGILARNQLAQNRDYSQNPRIGVGTVKPGRHVRKVRLKLIQLTTNN